MSSRCSLITQSIVLLGSGGGAVLNPAPVCTTAKNNNANEVVAQQIANRHAHFVPLRGNIKGHDVACVYVVLQSIARNHANFVENLHPATTEIRCESIVGACLREKGV